MSAPVFTRWAFIVLLPDRGDRARLAQLLGDVTLREASERAVFLSAPEGGKKFFTSDAGTEDWARQHVADGAQQVYLLIDEPGLRTVVARHKGLFYIGVSGSDEVQAYDGMEHVTAFVAKSPLDFVPRVLRDWNGASESRDGLFGRSKELQVIALTNKAPSQEAVAIDDDVVLALQRTFPIAILPAASVVSDIWTVDDKLGYRPFADAIAAFLRHKDTRAPLTVGIRAPWGAGKTSLMRMIRDMLDPRDANGKRSVVRLQDAGRTPADGPSVATVLRMARRRSLQEQGPAKIEAGQRVTVWFNPWMYQTGEQIWAGLANEIIRQVTERMGRGQRETFWLRINLRRVDREAVRRVVYGVLLHRLIAVASLLGVAAVAVCALLLTSADRAVAGTVLGVGGGLTVATALLQYLMLRREHARDVLGSLVRWRDPMELETVDSGATVPLTVAEPSYAARAGFLQFVHSDVRSVLDLVATEQQPLVVFIDDLDRCSPRIVAQVIEAVNAFLAGEFPNCLFVMAMEPRATVASIELAYKQLFASLSTPPGEGPSPGWRFLDKLVQLPLQLPSAARRQVLYDYLGSLDQPLLANPDPGSGHGDLASGEGSPADHGGLAYGAAPTDAAADLPIGLTGRHGEYLSHDDLIEQLGQASKLDEICEKADWLRSVGAASDEEVTQAATEVFDARFRPANSEVIAVVSSELGVLRVVNGREVKRFVNLFRFYAVIGVRRRLQGHESATIREAATLAALAARWPDVVGVAREPSVLTALRDAPPDADEVLDAGLRAIPRERLTALAAFLGSDEHALSSGALELLVG